MDTSDTRYAKIMQLIDKSIELREGPSIRSIRAWHANGRAAIDDLAPNPSFLERWDSINFRFGNETTCLFERPWYSQHTSENHPDVRDADQCDICNGKYESDYYYFCWEVIEECLSLLYIFLSEIGYASQISDLPMLVFDPKILELGFIEPADMREDLRAKFQHAIELAASGKYRYSISRMLSILETILKFMAKEYPEDASQAKTILLKKDYFPDPLKCNLELDTDRWYFATLTNIAAMAGWTKLQETIFRQFNNWRNQDIHPYQQKEASTLSDPREGAAELDRESWFLCRAVLEKVTKDVRQWVGDKTRLT